MRTHLRIALAAAVTALLAPAAALSAQRGPAQVPGELASALLSGSTPWGDAAPEILVGRAPADLPQGILLPRDSVLGAAVFPRHAMVVVFSRDDAEPTLAAVRQRLAASGWRQPPGPELRGGFASAASLPSGYCDADGTYLTTSTLPRSAGGSYLRLSVLRQERVSPCDPRPDRAVHDHLEHIPLPVLTPPAGAVTLRAGSSGGSESRESHARLRTDMGVPELTTHFAEQLTRAGWHLRQRVAGEGMALVAVELADQEGQRWTGMLSALAIPGTGERELAFRVAGTPRRP